MRSGQEGTVAANGSWRTAGALADRFPGRACEPEQRQYAERAERGR
jgi:hypothetical protein